MAFGMDHSPFDSIPIHVITLDPAGNVTTWNEDARRIAGYQAADILGRHCSALYTDDANEAGLPGIALTTAEVIGKHETNVSRRRKNGTAFLAHVWIQSLRDASGHMTGFVEVLCDLSGWTSTDRSTSYSKGTRASGRALGHELNNVLQVMKSGIQLLRRRIADGDGVSLELCEMVKEQIDQAARLTADLVPMSDGGVRSGAVEASASQATGLLSGLRVLIVEDESLVRMLVEDFLLQLDCNVIGVAASVKDALEKIDKTDIDLALLDVHLGSEQVDKVAEALRQRAIPFVFMSGTSNLSGEWLERPTIHKPFTLEGLQREMERAIVS